MITTPATNTVVLDELLDVLSHLHRQSILTHLSDHSPQDEDEFNQQTIMNENNSDLLSIELFHNHLPKLNNAGFIDWNQENDVVRRGSRFDEIVPLIALPVTHEDELLAGRP
jgi:hypothetical protein